ncbi:TetR/AcrR family transcriptional regulator [Arcticibacterium luteifluviistationis]|uniref:TetR/AcrR family transcriptional regulator n=1 Tax=Arcticibacterium luteifluviistationis TaxID=1784714 RepID=A0A2Z4GAY4_9BACT|nr:TetR/AcrR family transcriptional regulator [Arcticibacterium luteifluviistationis]AWV98304.1 TetR/AcrR family transcriptional regulator [Arcticibacterium luteifluviistationis]
MGRQKAYCEEEVIEKAMAVFWKNGYEATSVRMLEKEMGINQFSIYSSFGNKQGVFLESVKCYKKKLSCITDKLKASRNGIVGIKEYFYDFQGFSKDSDLKKGCMVANTMSETCEKSDPTILGELMKFSNSLKDLFIENLAQETGKDAQDIERQANYLMISLQGLSQASRVYSQEQLEDFIETTFSNL